MHFNSEQELFNHVAKALLAQNVRSADSTGCVYRSPQGKCAVGHCIDDVEYTPDMERHSVWQLLDAGWLPHLKPFAALLRSLQRIHDGTYPDAWQRELRIVAEDFGLSAAALDA